MSTLRQRKRQDEDDDYGSSKGKARISLETFDIYQKVRDEEKVQTASGATVSLVSTIICIILVLNEVYHFVFPKRFEHVAVDREIEGRLRINLDISFPSLPCSEANLDAMDVAGEQQNGVDHDMTKTRLDASGKAIGDAFVYELNPEAQKGVANPEVPLPADYCGPCYGAATRMGQCCNTCDEVRAAYAERGWDVADVTKNSEQCMREHRGMPAVSRPGEGCRIRGSLLVNRVAGNFHIAMGETHSRGAGHIHQFNPMQLGAYNGSHIVHSMSFGTEYPGIKNPLDNTKAIVLPYVAGALPDGSPAMTSAGVHMYYFKIIPTKYIKGEKEENSKVVSTNQYSVTSQFRPAVSRGIRQNILPGVFFVYEVSPFVVTVTEQRTPFLQVITSIFAILGGVLTMAGAVDALLYFLAKAFKVPPGGSLWQAILSAPVFNGGSASGTMKQVSYVPAGSAALPTKSAD